MSVSQSVVAVSSIVNVPVLVGVPDINPVELANESQEGRPDTLNLVVVAVDEVAVIVYEKPCPTTAEAVWELVITTGGQTVITLSVTVMVKILESLPQSVVAVIEIVWTPVLVGVPEITPVELANESQEGRPVTANRVVVATLELAVMVYEKA